MARLAEGELVCNSVGIIEFSEALALAEAKLAVQGCIADSANRVVGALLADRRAGETDQRDTVVIVTGLAGAYPRDDRPV